VWGSPIIYIVGTQDACPHYFARCINHPHIYIP
jgi:hypothetical protein